MLEKISKEIVLIADPRVLAVPIVENHDPVIDITPIGARHDSPEQIILIGPSPEIPNNTDYTKMRKAVYDRLLYAQTLLPSSLQFCLYEAYRSMALQKQLFDERVSRVRARYPDWTEAELFQESTKLISPVINLDGSPNVPPHSTGAAIDVYLIERATGKAVEMGIHPADWMDDTSGVLSQTETTHISKEAQHYRSLMSSALLQAGFVNYPTEFWHWSYGDRYWAYCSQNKTALYGSI